MRRHPALSIAALQSVVAVTGSLYFSEIAGYIPCELCWFQRAFMYPLVPLLVAGAIKNDATIWKSALYLAVPGFIISAYHNYIYYQANFGTPVQSFLPCAATADSGCAARYIEWLNFVTIPLLAFTAFSVIIVCCIVLARKTSKRA